MNATQVRLSVVSPAHNEAPNLDELYSRLEAALRPLGVDWELIIVDDGSTDETFATVRRLVASRSNVRGISLARSFGQNNAITAGLEIAHGEAVVVMDADLQDPPEVIPAMIEKWREGYRVVAGRRIRREGTPLLKRVLAFIYYRVMNALVEWDLPLDTGEFRLMDRVVVEALRQFPQRHRLMRTLVAWLGFEQASVDYVHAPRHAGRPSYSFRKSLRLAVTSITNFSLAPIRLALVTGTVIAFVAGCSMAWLLIQQMYGNPAPATTYIITTLWFLGGIQCAFIGIVGEYAGRAYMETQHRPLFVVREVIGSEHSKGTDLG